MMVNTTLDIKQFVAGMFKPGNRWGPREYSSIKKDVFACNGSLTPPFIIIPFEDSLKNTTHSLLFYRSVSAAQAFRDGNRPHPRIASLSDVTVFDINSVLTEHGFKEPKGVKLVADHYIALMKINLKYFKLAYSILTPEEATLRYPMYMAEEELQTLRSTNESLRARLTALEEDVDKSAMDLGEKASCALLLMGIGHNGLSCTVKPPEGCIIM